jgi:aspartyl-tRNA(Asn)/glutamyl-tRNA(Gln) amidotransferase subunit C
MIIDAKKTAHIASLAKLDPTHGLSEAAGQAALEKMSGELAAIISYIDVLAEADTQGVEPLYSLTDEAPGARADIPRTGNSDDILEQAPDRIGNFFAVPKIL